MNLRTGWSALVVVLGLCSMAVHAAPPTEAEKARKTAVKKLDSFEKGYDLDKDLSRKNPEKLEKDVAELDEVMAALAALDAPAAQDLAARKDDLVQKVRAAVSSASAGKADEEFTKRFEKVQASFDPDKKRLADVDAGTIKRARDELDRVIAKLEPAARKPYEDKRDALFTKLQTDILAAQLEKQRGELTKEVPEVKPAQGVEAIAPMAPTWCEGVETGLADLYSNYHVRELSLASDASGVHQLVAAVQFSCRDASFELRQKWVAAFRQTLSNRAGLSAATNEQLMRAAAKLALSRDEDAQLKATCAQFETLASGPVEARYSRALERVGMGCPGRLIDQANGVALNSIDVPNGLASQLAAAVLANRLITEGFSSNDAKLTGFAVANAVIAFDAAAFERELAGWKLSEVGRINATLKFYGVVNDMKALAAVAKARSASVLLDAPKKGAQAFTSTLGEKKELIDLALSLEDQARSGPLEGCAEKLYARLATEVKGNKAPLDEFRVEGLLAWALTFCAAKDPSAPVMESVFGYYAQRSTPVRGPFTAAYLALLDAHNAGAQGGGGARAGFDAGKQRGGAPSSSTAFSPGRNPIEPEDIGSFNTINPGMMPTGIVKSVEKQGPLTKISFRTEHYMVPVLECVETNRIDRITSDGTILYRTSCKKVGERPDESTNEPITVPTWAAAGVTAGSVLSYASAPVNDDVKGKPHRGWVVEAWDSAAKKKRTSLFGLAP